MSESDGEQDGIRDEDLPEDLQPGEDNPLASPPDDDEEIDRDDLDLDGGKTPEESSDDGDAADDEEQ